VTNDLVLIEEANGIKQKPTGRLLEKVIVERDLSNFAR
jgi:hypothetical protein